jgi:hypothetical protein
MVFFFKYPDGTDFLVGLQCFKSKTRKVQLVQDMHKHLLCLQNTYEKKNSKENKLFSPFGRKVSQDYLSKIKQHSFLNCPRYI